jgi:hypothetical protein
METNKSDNPAAEYLANVHKEQREENTSALPASVAHLFPNGTGTTVFQPDKPTSPLDKKPQDFAIAKETPAPAAPAPVLTAAPSADLEQPTSPPSDELPTPTGKRPLAHFGQALPVTKSKANRKLVLQLTPEMYQFFALAAALPGLDGVPVPDLALAILQAWREDYRPDIKKAAAAFFKA